MCETPRAPPEPMKMQSRDNFNREEVVIIDDSKKKPTPKRRVKLKKKGETDDLENSDSDISEGSDGAEARKRAKKKRKTSQAGSYPKRGKVRRSLRGLLEISTSMA